jgi:hypothetical protein
LTAIVTPLALPAFGVLDEAAAPYADLLAACVAVVLGADADVVALLVVLLLLPQPAAKAAAATAQPSMSGFLTVTSRAGFAWQA